MRVLSKTFKYLTLVVLALILASFVLILSGCSNAICDRCGGVNYRTYDEQRSTLQPVEVIYKRTTYKTRYVPQTTKEVTYEKRPYNCK